MRVFILVKILTRVVYKEKWERKNKVRQGKKTEAEEKKEDEAAESVCVM